MTTSKEVQERVRVAHRLLMRGYTPTETASMLSTQFGVDKRTGERYVSLARETYHRTDENILLDTELAMSQAGYLYQKALEAAPEKPLGEIIVALRALKLGKELRQQYREEKRYAIHKPETTDLSNTLVDALQDLETEGADSGSGSED